MDEGDCNDASWAFLDEWAEQDETLRASLLKYQKHHADDKSHVIHNEDSYDHEILRQFFRQIRNEEDDKEDDEEEDGEAMDEEEDGETMDEEENLKKPSRRTDHLRRGGRSRDYLDWQDHGWVEIVTHQRFGHAVICKDDLELRPLACEPPTAAYYQGGDLVKSEMFDAKGVITSAERLEQLRNVYRPPHDPRFRERPGDFFLRLLGWTTHINHGRPDKCNVALELDRLVQTKSLKAGDEVLLDYRVEYWCRQVCGLDYDTLSGEERKVWDAVHKRTSDYTALLQAGLVNADRAHLMDVLRQHIEQLPVAGEGHSEPRAGTAAG